MTIEAAVGEILCEAGRPQLLPIDPAVERRLDEARRRAGSRPAWVCHRALGIGEVCGRVVWGERPRHCSRCGAVFHE